jgi:hypothetical protein
MIDASNLREMGFTPHTSLPHTLTIICTYKCTAACAQCCFESNPRIKARLSLSTIIDRIDEAHREFGGLRLVVFTGGEAFLLREDLFKGIRHATKLGLSTRVVTNAYWGKSFSGAVKNASYLRDAGISEINISTGLDHQKYVAEASVINAAIALCGVGIPTLITVETDSSTSSCFASINNNEIVMDLVRRGRLLVQRNAWMMFRAEGEERQRGTNASFKGGCDQIFGNVVVTPYDNLSACCGLTLEHIPEMRLGRCSGENMRALYSTQYVDFLKYWIHVDGPEEIISRLFDGNTAVLDGVSHICEACVILHKNDDVKQKLHEKYELVIPEVMARMKLRNELIGREAAQEIPSSQG